jgi:CheY-like chemotaxis protein
MQGRVLILDDEPGICRMAASVLRRLGLTVVVAYEGEAAIEACRSAHAEGRPFDVLILDLTIPGGTGGREVLAAIRTFDGTAKAIVSSGYSNDAILANFSEHGFSACLAKPYQLTELIGTVRRTLSPTPSA